MSMFPKGYSPEWQRDDEHARIIRVKSLIGKGGILLMYERLQCKGWKCVTDGAYGYAFLHGNLCWKISRSGAQAGCDGYIAYVQAIVMGLMPNSAHLPRIKLVLIDEEGNFAVLMERLVHTLCDMPKSSMSEAIDTTRNAVWYNTDSYLDTHEYIWSLRKIMNFIKDAFDHSWHIDFHSGNIMMRANGQAVITDPISGMHYHTCPAREVYTTFVESKFAKIQ